MWSSGHVDHMGETDGELSQVGETDVWFTETTFEDVDEDVGLIGLLLEETNFTMRGLIIDVIRHDGAAPSGPGRVICDDSEPLPLMVDPNVTTVYEAGETEGDFDVYLARPPFSGNVTIVIDPNNYGGWGEGQLEDKDIELLQGVEPDNQVT